MGGQQAVKGGRGRIDFTAGRPWKKIIVFALPLMLSNLLQQLYNTVGSIIVGRGKALARIEELKRAAPVAQGDGSLVFPK